ncbi:hypothetical protein P280DRAFT_269143 [Massarina eburnea CBS 473.64]|uniref:F-box domain-containing protein n=1 Tax=Massarina eburnea CBS 473.64 TaxID=1395130 RepID=A0A6A6S3W7_9PLEO|nr:hypothetical protein P280DRAFT_269143 [Massarina eburnea CBS 473.64]
MSPILSLPLELRELIYEYIFSSYTVRRGFHTTSSNRTALLQTCKQIHHEAWRHLPMNARFHFCGTEAMLDSLLSVDQAVLTRVRHIRVKAFTFPLYATRRQDLGYYPTYYFNNALSLLPGLHLDELVVEDCFHGFGLLDGYRDVVTYFDIENLLKSDAWKKLVYITPNTDFIASGYDHRRKRRAQPETWDTMVKERDGPESGAHVELWITPETTTTPRPWKARPGTDVVENWRLATPEQELKGEVRVIAHRGKGAAYTQTGMSQKMPWEELKGKEGGFAPENWTPYYNDMADAVGWVYGGYGRRMMLASRALGHYE